MKEKMKKIGLFFGAALLAVALGMGGAALYKHVFLSSASKETSQTTSPSTDSQSAEKKTSASSSEDVIVRKVESADELVIADENTEQENQVNDKKQTSKGYDFSLLQSGDFSALSGTWKDGNGHSLVFNTEGLVAGGTGLAWSEAKHGILLGSIYFGYIGASIQFIPAGVDASVETVDGRAFKDPSDHGKNRIWVGQSANEIANQNDYFYLVSSATQEDTATSSLDGEETSSASSKVE